MGYHLAGYNVLLAVEMDDHAVATYKANFPNTTIYHGDIHNLTVEKIFEITGLKGYSLKHSSWKMLKDL